MTFLAPHAVPTGHAPLRMAAKCLAPRQPLSSSHVQSPVLIHDGIPVDTPPLTAQEFLSQHRSYSYTTALVCDNYHVTDWRLHLERLLRNMHVLGRRQTPVYSAFMAWTQQQGLGDTAVVELLDALICPQAAQALQHLAAGQGQQQQGRAMMTVLLTDPQQQQQELHRQQPSQSAGLPLSVLMWTKSIPALQESKYAKVLVAGDPRPLAHAKHCDWVVARQPLEPLKQQAGADEVILSNSTGQLLEGLVSNWYVIADEGQCEISCRAAAAGASPIGSVDAGHPESAAGSSNSLTKRRHASDEDATSVSSNYRTHGGVSSLVLLTTGPGHDALLGVTQQRVLEAANSVGIKVVQRPSNVEQAPAWSEAFITNCLRGIQPVSTVVDTAGRTIWSSPSECGVITRQLQEALRKTCIVTDMTASRITTTAIRQPGKG